MFSSFIQVAAGGALGAAMRYGVGLAVLRTTAPGFPFAVLLVNVVGSFLMGFILVTLNQRGLDHLGPFLLTGVLGGFTTFSAFSLEAFTLYEQGALCHAALYVGLSVALSIGGLALGVVLARGVI